MRTVGKSRGSITLKRFTLVALASASMGCAHTPVSLTFSEAFGLRYRVEDTQLNPNLRYLRVVIDGHSALMVLGYVEPSPKGSIETWYSNSGEVLQLSNGRLWSTSGLRVDWRAVQHLSQPPSWNDVVSHQTQSVGQHLRWRYQRQLDKMPGYRFGQKQVVTLRPVPVQNDAALLGIKPDELHWFEEALDDRFHLKPSARYGLLNTDGKPRVVYGEQCLESSSCLSWQEWPIRKSGP